jgi:D-alanyl-D-alanine carboxypeptidase
MLNKHQIKAYKRLGISIDYGIKKKLPFYDDAEDLISIGPNIFGREQRLSEKTAISWMKLVESASKDNISILSISGFRSFAYQEELIFNKLKKGMLIDDILKVNAPPGYSQHHAGIAIDIATIGAPPLTEAFEITEAFQWLERFALDFNFSMPYVKNNIYGFIYEPWHWSVNE